MNKTPSGVCQRLQVAGLTGERSVLCGVSAD